MGADETDKMERFTAYLSADERRNVRQQAKVDRTSENHVLRTIIRQHFLMGAKPDAPDEAERV